jgi:polar amino acid transport system substrate-binding protein
MVKKTAEPIFLPQFLGILSPKITSNKKGSWMKMTYRLVFQLFALTFFCFSCGEKDKNQFLVGMEVGYPPMEMVDNDGKTPIGFDVDVAKEISKRLGKADVQIINTSWDGIFVALETNKFDCIISAVSITPERESAFALSKPYIANKLVLVCKKDNLEIKTPDDLLGKLTGVQVSTTAEDYIKKLKENGKNIEYTPYQKVTQGFVDLKIGRIQAVLVDIVVAKYYLKQDTDSFIITWESPDSEPLGIAFSNKNKGLRDQVNKIIDTMKEDGTMAKISNKWFADDLTK